MATINLSPEYPQEPGPILIDVGEPSVAEGLPAICRIGFQSIEVIGLRRQLRVGDVLVVRTVGPIKTRRTTVVQRPSAPLVWDKTEYDSVDVGDGLPMTVGHLPIVLPTTEQTPATFARWRDQIYSAVGVLAALLDDRIGHAELFLDFLIHDDRSIVGIADYAQNVRNYAPFDVTADDVTTLAGLQAIAPDIATAARWYLRAAQVGPAADGLAYLWTSLEALTKAEGRKVVAKVEEALRDTGADPEQLDPRLGPIWGERAQIVHLGQTEPTELMVRGWYVLEHVARTLLRAGMSVDTTWPTRPDDTTTLRPDVRDTWENTPWHTEWHNGESGTLRHGGAPFGTCRCASST